MKINKKKKKLRKVIERDGKFYTIRGVELTRNCHTITEAEYFSMILSALRRTTRFWKPIVKCLKEGERKSQSDNKRLKWEYHCEACNNWFPKSQIQIDHIVPCGGINGYDKIVPWLKRAHIETGFQRLCRECHKTKTKQEKCT